MLWVRQILWESVLYCRRWPLRRRVAFVINVGHGAFRRNCFKLHHGDPIASLHCAVTCAEGRELIPPICVGFTIRWPLTILRASRPKGDGGISQWLSSNSHGALNGIGRRSLRATTASCQTSAADKSNSNDQSTHAVKFHVDVPFFFVVSRPRKQSADAGCSDREARKTLGAFGYFPSGLLFARIPGQRPRRVFPRTVSRPQPLCPLPPILRRGFVHLNYAQVLRCSCLRNQCCH